MTTININYSKLLKTLPELRKFNQDLTSIGIISELEDRITEFDEIPDFKHDYLIMPNVYAKLDQNQVLLIFKNIKLSQTSIIAQFIAYCLYSDATADLENMTKLTEDEFYQKYTQKVTEFLNN